MTQPIVPKELLTATAGGLSVLIVSGGADGQVLTQQADGTYAPEAVSAGIGGSVGSTTNRLVKSSGTGGSTVQATGITVDSSDNLSGVNALSASSVTVGAVGVAAVITAPSTASNGLRLTAYNGMEVWNSQYGYQMLQINQGLLTVNNDVSTGGHLKCNTAGKSLQMQSGTGARAGNATLVAGTVTVTNTTVTAKTHIFLTVKTAGGTLGTLSYTLSAGASFTINSSSISDTSTVSYFLIEVN